MQAASDAGFFFDLFIKLNGILLELSDIRIAIQRMEAASRVPRGTGGQFRTFDQHDIGPARFGEMIKNRTADDAAANYHYFCTRLHRLISASRF